jgi:hypothetical protein
MTISVALDDDLAHAATVPGESGRIRIRLSPPVLAAAACVAGLCALVLMKIHPAPRA